MLCGFSTDEGCSCLLTAFRNTLYDRGNLLRIVLSTRNIIKEKQGFSTGTGYIVHTHGNRINSNGIMLVH